MEGSKEKLDLFRPDIDLSALCLRGDPTAVITEIFGWDGKHCVGVDYERGGQGYTSVVGRDGRQAQGKNSDYDIIYSSDYKGLSVNPKEKGRLSNIIKNHRKQFNIKGK